MPRKPETTRIIPPYSETISGDDHSLLINLDADDHAQYHTDARALTWINTITNSVIQAFDQQLQDIADASGTTGDLLRWDGANWSVYPDSNFATSGHNHGHNTLTNLTWTASAHTGTINYLAGFDGTGSPVNIDPTSIGNTDHTGLTNLPWTSSGHTGSINQIAGFSGAGAAAEYEIGVDIQAYDAALDVLASLPFTGDGEFLVGTGAGTATLESGNTARTSLELGDDSTVQHRHLTLSHSVDPKLTIVEDGSMGFELYDATAGAAVIQKLGSASASLQISSVPGNGTSVAAINFHPDSTTSGEVRTYIYDGTGAIQHRIRSNGGNSAWHTVSGQMSIGYTTNREMLDINGGIALDYGVFDERSSAPTIAAGEGGFWVRDDAPSVPMFTDDAGTSRVLATLTATFLERDFHTDVAVVPNDTHTITWMCPFDATIKGIHLLCKTVPSSAGTYLFTSAGAGNNMLSTTNFDLETLTADTQEVLTLTATTANLDLSKGDLVTLVFTSNNADLTATGLYVQLVYEAR